MSGDSNRSRAYMAHIASTVLPRLAKATIPLYAVVNDQLRRDRSAVFLQVGNDYFLLTAAHRLQLIVEHQVYLYAGSDDETITVPLGDARFHSTRDDSTSAEEDSRDVAVIKLSDVSAARLRLQYEPIGLLHIAYEADKSPGLFVIYGYPKAWLTVQESKVDSRPLAFLSDFYEGDLSPDGDLPFDPYVHELFICDRNALGDGKDPVQLPPIEQMRGISGCGVWRVCRYKNGGAEDTLEMVAILHRYAEDNGYVHTTWAKHVVDLLISNYPDVEKVTSLHLPSTKQEWH